MGERVILKVFGCCFSDFKAFFWGGVFGDFLLGVFQAVF